ncbi:MAG: iron-sulfur cluster-binding protein [Sphingobacteriia bacterium 24-36-13]|jgi:L-lactate dehydrogenase complex protein LldF|uniref:LutB/LldF family L-lactate oxidation iron-sulfur protein n=1 Tax=Sediminibacterium sp. TaxID=1917865 RepID=UPI000BD6B108|nr:LutB/LldF family L-lactate oxidation iron-sulfur protein [Sediminibacterium sp.]OYY09040.1 MAG: iron-sulfur cluster-binding protein [Sphingobacteriia bacterium 35-36-14]OYZ52560.1 MAG: iron-sulfur cluster-binding protein [Sphingobacteriia bacterium 24-36-13]OZA63166.1 MAG: iron-sulfur cluster-binding protein [Sphingobacteriia bacterium 39-36-14]HQS24547.1 LutB/LldF family L-lactate oxidation iron-sulfur protein [Sediminibacterium sp.]HQS35959.1 LutB/LldF family L-lactate oxidation iron-sulf
MSNTAATFIAKSTIKAADLEHRRKINFNIGKYNAVVPIGKKQFTDVMQAREIAKNKKWDAIEHLDQYLLEFEEKITARGAKVLWAETAEEALTQIGAICKEKQCKTLVKSKSMVTEEIHLNSYLEKNGIESVETDLGEYIQQLDGEAPYHIVTPAMHKSKEDVARLFADKLGVPGGLSPEELTLVARQKLREKYVQAEIGVTGANFILPDIGAIAITENEGNGRLSCAWPKTHIVIVGIEKVIPSVHDLALFWPLLSTYGTGQKVTVYNTIISGPKQANETDGPEEMIVILLDNGRTNLLANKTAREALYCIRCGACLNACPVYKNIGGHAYDTTYSGPIGKVITPYLKGLDEYKHLSYASSLCGNCTEVCPVRINLHELLLDNRHEAVVQGNSSLAERIAWKVWKTASLNRVLMNAGNGKMKNWVVNKVFKGWTAHRSELDFSAKTFNELWKEANHS